MHSGNSSEEEGVKYAFAAEPIRRCLSPQPCNPPSHRSRVCRSCHPAAYRSARCVSPKQRSAPPWRDRLTIKCYDLVSETFSIPPPTFIVPGFASTPRRRGARPRSERTVEGGPSRNRHRGRATPLPPAFPPPSRGIDTTGGDGDGASTSSTSSRSTELDRSRVAVAAAAGLGAPANELELSVPSHQEHLTADGQR